MQVLRVTECRLFIKKKKMCYEKLFLKSLANNFQKFINHLCLYCSARLVIVMII